MKGCSNYLSFFLTVLTSSLLACSSSDFFDKIYPPAVLTPQEVNLPQAAVSIAAGHNHNCAITTSGETYCWGNNEYGQLGSQGANEECGTGSYECSSTPLLLSTPVSYIDLSCEVSSSCGLDADGIVSCWGLPPIKPFTSDITPKLLPGDIRFQSISVGDNIGICGIADDEETYCLSNDPDYDNSTVPVAVSNGLHFIRVESGESHACGLTALGDIYCWGNNWSGQLGVPPEQSGGIPYSLEPVAAGTGITWRDLAVGSNVTCGLSDDGLTYCWGSIGGLTTEENMADQGHLPSPVSNNIHFDKIFVGGYHKICGLTDTGEAYCWGSSGLLGNGSYDGSPIPARVAGNISFTTLAVGGGGHICGIENSGMVYCWGLNYDKATGRP